jgi:hypothetical protein
MDCSGLHCGGCGKGSGGIGAIVLLILVAFILAKGHAIEHAADEVIHVLIIVACVTAGTAITGIGAYLYIGHNVGVNRERKRNAIQSITIHPPINRTDIRQAAINPPQPTLNYLNEMWQHQTGDSDV